jgi:hypothetical protein
LKPSVAHVEDVQLTRVPPPLPPQVLNPPPPQNAGAAQEPQSRRFPQPSPAMPQVE